MNPVVHFELPYENRERAERFYATVFGWKTQFLGAGMGDYVLVTTADAQASPGAAAGAINGGLFQKKSDWPQQHPAIVIAVQDIEQSMQSVKDAGGDVLGEPHMIPNTGRYVAFVDSEGNRNSMLEPACS